MTEKYDVIVSGLGPAGSSAAYRLAQYGFKVLALERKKMPRDKLCAGGLTTKVLPMLDFDFSDTVEREISGGVVHYKRERSLEVDFGKTAGYVVDRALFDHRLAKRAIEAGTEVHEGEGLKGITQFKDHVEVMTNKGGYHSRFLIGADGANGYSARYIRKKRRVLGFAVEAFVPEEHKTIRENGSNVAFFYGNLPFGYGWIFPKANGASVGLGVSYKYAKQSKMLFDE